MQAGTATLNHHRQPHNTCTSLTQADALPRRARAPHLALALNSGLYDLHRSWTPTLAALLAARVPLALTSYHAQEAELDARTLKVRPTLTQP